MSETNKVNGWLNLHKPVGITSAKAVAIVKKHVYPAKIGHAGTLDPLASGVLPLAIGEATKTIQFCMDSDKEYEFTIKWGEATATCDSEGEVTARSGVRPAREQILAVLPEFTGLINQVPPQYSAIKINGRRAYDLARSGQEVEMQARNVVVHKLELKDKESSLQAFGEEFFSPDSHATLRVCCGKGTYVRSLARDIALKLGTVGHVTALVRTKVGNFMLKDAILLEDIGKAVYKHESLGELLPLETVLDDIQVLELTPEEAALIRRGQRMEVRNLSCAGAFGAHIYSSGIFIAKCESLVVAICKSEAGIIKPLRVFNL